MCVPTITELVKALDYIDSEFCFKDGDKVCGEHWAEALASLHYPNNLRANFKPTEAETRRAKSVYTQLDDHTWERFNARAKHMYEADGYAFFDYSADQLADLRKTQESK